MVTKQVRISTVTGFARPASLMVGIASNFKSQISLRFKGKNVNLKNSPFSIMDVMSLGIMPGETFSLQAKGIDEIMALKAIKYTLIKADLIKDNEIRYREYTNIMEKHC